MSVRIDFITILKVKKHFYGVFFIKIFFKISQEYLKDSVYEDCLCFY